MQSVPSLVLLGASHRTASVEIRGQLAAVLPMLRGAARESVTLTTCNRAEIYLDGEDAGEMRRAIEQRLAGLPADSFAQARRCVYVLEGREAATHLMRVAAGLDSIVLGESQILGQVNRALAEAAATGRAGALLSRLFTSAIHAGKRAHNEMGIGRFPTSVSHVAVKLLECRLGDLPARKVLTIGAGKMAQLTAQVLRKRGVPQLAFINRTPEKARILASEFKGQLFAWENLREAIAWADVVIAATASPVPVLRACDISEHPALESRPLSIMDMGSPRNVAPDVESLPGVQYAGIDDLDSSLDENLEKRRAAVPEVEALIDREVDAYLAWRHHRRVVPLIADLRRKVERVANDELERTFGALRHLNPDDRHAIARAVHRIAGKLMHEPTVRLKSTDAAERGYDHVVRHLFGLSEPEPATSEACR